MYLEFLRGLNESTDDYLFLWELQKNKIWYFGGIDKQYNLQEGGKLTCTTEEVLEIVYPKDRKLLTDDFQRIIDGLSDVHNLDYRWMNKNGEIVWISCRGKVQTNSEGRPFIMVGRVSDTALKHKVDSLTRMFNKTKMSEDLEEVLYSGKNGFLMLLGVDDLKNINIRNGREFGNQVLKQVGRTLEDVVGNPQRTYRLDGDCFAIRMSSDTQEEVCEIYKQIQEKLADICTVSAGAVPYHVLPIMDSEILYQYAEDAMDRAKKKGKNNLAFFSSDDFEKKLSDIELLEEIKQSVQNGCKEFSLFYQPQVEEYTYRVYGAEALLRYDSPNRGRVMPNEFIPVLERTGLICEVGLWVLETALNQCKIWREKSPNFHISVNISYMQLQQADIAEKVMEILDKSNLPGEALTLEVTESMQLQDYQYLNRIFYKWKKAGIEISVDDFGTGYSSLGYLKSLKIDEIKIDRCFVSGIQLSAYNYRLLSNVLELAHSSQIRVCCEGVEEEEELKVLEKLNPDLLQGYFFSKPCEKNEFEKFYIESNIPEYKERLKFIGEIQSDIQLKGLQNDTNNLETVMEALEELIYVSDLETHELLYMNPASCSMTGVYDYKGQKCYKVIQGKYEPCTFCNNDCLKKEDFLIWESENTYWKRNFILKDKLISWNGRPARLEVGLDVTERENLTKKVEEKLDFAENVLDCAKVLAQETDMNKAVQEILQYVGEFYQADRAYLFEPDECYPEQWNNTYEWCEDGISSEKNNLQNVTQDILQRWLELFKTDSSIVITNVDSIREKSPLEWEVLYAQGIRRLIVAPIKLGKRLIGFIGVDNQKHCIQDDAQIRMMALFMASRLQKNETEERLGELLNFHHRDILSATDLGLWVIRIDKEADRYEMYVDETMRRVLAIEKEYTPEEVYIHWHSRISDGYYNYVHRSVDNMINSGNIVQLQYTWNHPSLGEVQVRCTGIRVEDNDGMICLEGYHRMINSVDQTQFLSEQPSCEVFEYNERKSSIYFHSARTLLDGDGLHENNFPDSWIEQEIVHPHFRNKFKEIFTNVEKKENIEGLELLLKSGQGEYSWFKLNTRHLGEEVRDRNTIVVQLNVANQERVMELESMRIKEFYRASLSETIAYAELDLESGYAHEVGGLWTQYEQTAKERKMSLLQYLMELQNKYVQENNEDITSNAEVFKEIMYQGNQTRRVTYKHLVGKEWHWVELVVHTFKEQFSENMYALLYLKDIDVQKRQDIAQKKAAELDGLTGVYNRRVFKENTEQYLNLSDGTRQGVIIMMDIDDFKSVNDKYGHLIGDEVLKYVASCLQSIFCKGEVIGRFGGDEFMVFIKGEETKEIINQKMDYFFEKLAQYKTVPIMCSAGITFVKGKDFLFTESLGQVDDALYQSKQNGKNQYCYAEEKVC